MDATVGPYDGDREALWGLKRGFELGLGSETGGDEKRARYEAKLTDDYREEWLAWVGRCVDEDPDCVQVARTSDGLVGYAFVLPPSMAFVWDAAVLNELYLEPRARGTGVADDLMTAALDCARAQDLPLAVVRADRRVHTWVSTTPDLRVLTPLPTLLPPQTGVVTFRSIHVGHSDVRPLLSRTLMKIISKRMFIRVNHLVPRDESNQSGP